MKKYNDAVIKHYEKVWGQKGSPKKWEPGPVKNVAPELEILEFAPSSKRKMWTYATAGMPGIADTNPLELHLFSPVQTDIHVETLAVIVHFHRTGQKLDIGHTLNIGRPWLPHSKASYGLISLPYLDGPELEWCNVGDRRVRFLWLIPITEAERDYKVKYGGECPGRKNGKKRISTTWIL
ncbi:MAG: suppressor of fused domain protein [Bacteroidota bacterium]